MVQNIYPPFNADTAREGNIFGTKIREIRIASGLKQKDVIQELKARGLSIFPSTYNRWEKGETLPNIYQTLALFDSLGIYFPFEIFSSGESLTTEECDKLAEYRNMLIVSGQYRKEKEPVSEEVIGLSFHSKKYDVDARGILCSENHVRVLTGSRISPDSNLAEKGWNTTERVRQDLIEKGIIVDRIFTQDYEFNTPTGASSVIAGRHIGGTEFWKTEDGKKLGNLLIYHLNS